MFNKPVKSKSAACSSVTDESEVLKQNFWEIGNYSIALKRTETSSKLTSDLLEMLEELSTIEAKFGKTLCGWSEKWGKYLATEEEGNDSYCYLYGSTKEGLDQIIQSVHEKGKAHVDNWSQTHALCIYPLLQYQEKTIHKSFNSLKEVKELKEDFHATQKPYIENYDKYKKAYSRYISYLRSKKDNFVSDGNTQSQKDNGNFKKSKKLEKLRKKSEERKEQLNLMIPRYTKNMNELFLKCDEIEQIKLNAIKSALEGIHFIHSVQNNEKNANSLKMQKEALSKIKIEQDLDLWNCQHGPGMSYDFNRIPNKTPRRFSLFRGSLTIGDDPDPLSSIAPLDDSRSSTVTPPS